MKKRNLLLVILAVLLVFGLVVGCGPADDEEGTTKPGGGGTTTTAVTYGVTANGDATTATTQLTLTFDKDITGLAATNIAVSGLDVVKGSLGGSGKVYTLGVDCSKSGNLTVTVTAPSGFSITTANATKTVAIKDPFDIYYHQFYATYGTNRTHEDIFISKNLIKIKDNEDLTNPDFLDFTITKWEFKGNVPTSITSNTTFLGSYEISIQLTGKITAAKPDGTGGTNVFGGVTCPGFTNSDIGNATAYLYLYFTDEDDIEDNLLLRSAFSKTAPSTPPAKITNRDEYQFYE